MGVGTFRDRDRTPTSRGGGGRGRKQASVFRELCILSSNMDILLGGIIYLFLSHVQQLTEGACACACEKRRVGEGRGGEGREACTCDAVIP